MLLFAIIVSMTIGRGEYYEGPGAQDVIIEKNRIVDVNRYPAAADYPSAISAGVHFSPGYSGIIGTPIHDIVVRSNRFSNASHGGEPNVSFGRGALGSQSE